MASRDTRFVGLALQTQNWAQREATDAGVIRKAIAGCSASREKPRLTSRTRCLDGLHGGFTRCRGSCVNVTTSTKDKAYISDNSNEGTSSVKGQCMENPNPNSQKISNLEKLAELRLSGALTDSEFETLKAEIIAGGVAMPEKSSAAPTEPRQAPHHRDLTALPPPDNPVKGWHTDPVLGGQVMRYWNGERWLKDRKVSAPSSPETAANPNPGFGSPRPTPRYQKIMIGIGLLGLVKNLILWSQD